MFARLTEAFERLDNNRGRGNREDRAKKDAIHFVPPKCASKRVACQNHQQDLEGGRDECRGADFLQFAQAELEPQRKHKKNDPQLGERLYGMLVRDEREGRSVRSDDDSCQNVPKDDRLLELAEDDRGHSRHAHHNCQILQKGCLVHVRGFPPLPKTDTSSGFQSRRAGRSEPSCRPSTNPDARRSFRYLLQEPTNVQPGGVRTSKRRDYFINFALGGSLDARKTVMDRWISTEKTGHRCIGTSDRRRTLALSQRPDDPGNTIRS